MAVRLTDIIAPSFYEVHRDVCAGQHTHYVLKGGRGSTKSSYISLEIVCGIIKNPDAHAIVFRKIADTLRDSVFAQMLWAIDKLGVSQYFKATVSPMKITYLPTGQTIMFRGLDDPMKVKSIKIPFGYFRYIWFEEWNQFSGMRETDNVLQSVMRGGSKFDVFYSYNPPESLRAWVNDEVRVERADRLVHHSTYLTVPQDWIGAPLLLEAEHLKQHSPERYRHEFLGEVTGTGGEVFRNISIRPISAEEIARFDRIRRGIDWGYAVDPFVFISCNYDKPRRRLYIYDEIYAAGMSNRLAADRIKSRGVAGEIIADSAEPKSIADMYEYGLRVRGARKGPDSVKHGIEWLRDLDEIIIDPARCPNAAREFSSYELERDKDGNYKANYPDRDNHTIDATRYATENDQQNVRVT